MKNTQIYMKKDLNFSGMEMFILLWLIIALVVGGIALLHNREPLNIESPQKYCLGKDGKVYHTNQNIEKTSPLIAESNTEGVDLVADERDDEKGEVFPACVEQ